MSFRQQNQWKKFGGAGCLVLNYYNRQWTPLLGLQRGGKRQGKFNICSGKMEQQDNCCYVATVIRELNEEFKLQITEKSLGSEWKFPRIQSQRIANLYSVGNWLESQTYQFDFDERLSRSQQAVV